MSTRTAAAARAGLGIFERYLSVWVGLCIVAGIGLGHLAPGTFASLPAPNSPMSIWSWPV